jgi:putative addiction module component (TIGR02574 family)
MRASQTPQPQPDEYDLAMSEQVPPNKDLPLSDEWLAEIQRRSAELKRGEATLVSWEQIKADALRRNQGPDASEE